MNKSGTNMTAVAKGGGVVAAGIGGGLLLQLVSGIIVIRMLEGAEFGLISLGSVVVNIAAVLLLLGLGNGLPRFIAKVRDLDSGKKIVGELVGTSMLISLMLSSLGALLISFFSADIASSMSKPELQPVLFGFAWMIPPLVLTKNLSAIFQGVQYARPKVIFEDWAVDGIRLVLMIGLFMIGVTFQYVIAAYIVAVWAAFLLYALYAYRYLVSRFSLSCSMQRARELVLFSLPLLGVGLINGITIWSGTAILGFTQTASEVALYVGPARIVVILLVPLTSLLFIYGPASTRLYIAGNLEALQGLYASTTKWASLISLWMATFCIADAEFIVTMLLGDAYIDSANILRVFSLGYCVNTLAGPNAVTLISIGETKKVLFSSFTGGIFAIFVSLCLVDSMAALGVAFGTSSGMILSNVMLTYFLKRQIGIHAINIFGLSITMVSITLGAFWYLTFEYLHESEWFLHLAAPVLSGGVFLIAPFLMKQISIADFEMIRSLELKILKGHQWSDRLALWLKI